MKIKQIHYLFIANFAIFFIGTGLFPLLPIYAANFGAGKTIIGIYMATTYISFTVGTMLSGWVINHFAPKRVFILAGGVGALSVMLMGQATILWHLIVLSAVVWFTGGFGLALIAIFVGQTTEKANRGKSFGLIFLSFPLASLLSGLVVGRLFEWGSYSTMFVFLSAVFAIWPLVGWLFIQINPIKPTQLTKVQSSGRFSNAFYLLLIMAFLLSVAMYAGRLGLTFTMTALDFSVSDISSTTAVSGLVTIPLALMLSVWSDKLGRQMFLFLSFGLVIAAVMYLNMSSQIWQFWLVSVLFQVANAVLGSIFPAFATDILPSNRLASGLTWLNGMNGVAGVIGLALTGFVIENVGTTVLYGGSAGLALIGILILAILSAKKLSTAVYRVPGQINSQIQKVRLQRATKRAYVTFAVQHPRWAQSLFDERFLTQNARSLLQEFLTCKCPTALALADIWTAQLPYREEKSRQRHLEQITPITNDYLRLLKQELAPKQLVCT